MVIIDWSRTTGNRMAFGIQTGKYLWEIFLFIHHHIHCFYGSKWFLAISCTKDNSYWHCICHLDRHRSNRDSSYRYLLLSWFNKYIQTAVCTADSDRSSRGSVVILGGLSFVNSLHAYTFASLKRKKLISTTPLNDALNALILALNASAAAFVLLFTKKFKILS